MSPELSRPLALDRVGATLDFAIEATAGECAALASRLGIPAVGALRCEFRLRRGEAGRVAAEGALRARVTRECVVSLDEFEVEAMETFRVVFVPEGTEVDDPDPDSDDEIPYAGGAIDLGEAAAEQLALSLDPYPRKPDVVLPEAAAEPPDSPFAALARRKTEG